MFEFLRRAGLLQRVGLVEGLDFHALLEYPHDGRHGRGVAVEEARAENLGRDADVREGGGVTVTELPGFLFLGKMRFDGFQPQRTI